MTSWIVILGYKFLLIGVLESLEPANEKVKRQSAGSVLESGEIGAKVRKSKMYYRRVSLSSIRRLRRWAISSSRASRGWNSP